VKRDIGLALSGGGFRAAAFHLGCLRALDDRGLLPRVRIISGVSGGALLAALYAYGPVEFEAFDRSATGLLRRGLEREVVRRALLSRRAVQSALSLASLPVAGALTLARRLASPGASDATAAMAHGGPARLRRVNRTTALADVLAERLFGERVMPEVTHAGLDVVLTACDLGTGGAVRFGSRTSSSSRLGEILDDVSVASAVAASAAFPAFLPAIEQRYRLRDRSGAEADRVLLLTDGGVYDNLGLSVFGVDREEQHTPHVYDADYVIACDAGQGLLAPAAPHVWPTRMKRVVDIMHGRAQHGERGQLYAAKAGGHLSGFVYAFLGMRDDRLPVPISDLVPREFVAGYPTDFRAMSGEDLDAISTRGEQLVRALLPRYCSMLD
jgi:NTE family protein